MYETRWRHRPVVYVLLVAFLTVLTILLITLFKVRSFDDSASPSVSERSPTASLPAAPTPVAAVPPQTKGSVIVKSKTSGEAVSVLPVEKVFFEYIEVVDSCGPYFGDTCVNARSGPGTDYPVVLKLRKNMILKVSGKVERDGTTWYKIAFDENLLYPERVKGDWYVAASYVHTLLDEGTQIPAGGTKRTTKKIIVNRTLQTLRAYDGDDLFMSLPVSTGLELTPTPTGTFSVFKKMPSRYMQGPIPDVSDDFYDLPGVPWDLYFTSGGAAIHGAYWHIDFGNRHSHGCVNLPPEKAHELYDWADLGTLVVVED
jgi:lipoprotein-anchoring transpeptidase ErfK/SrfK